MKKIISALAFAAILFLNIGCSSDDNTPPPPPPTTQELLIGTWKIQEEGEIANDVKKAYPMTDCEAKDTYEFTKDFKHINNYHEDYPANECTALFEKGSWKLQDQKLQVTYIDENDPQDIETSNLTIEKISATELHLQEKDSEIEGQTYYLILKRN